MQNKVAKRESEMTSHDDMTFKDFKITYLLLNNTEQVLHFNIIDTMMKKLKYIKNR